MFNKRENEEPILRKKQGLNLDIFKKNIYLLVIGLILFLGTSFGLTFFIQNKKIGEVALTIGDITYTITQDRSISINNLKMNIPNIEGLQGFSKEITIRNTSDINGKLELKINRTSGVSLKGLRYGLYINDVLIDVSNMPSDGVIYHSAILGNEEVKAKVVLWLQDDYSTSVTTFVGNIDGNITSDSTLATTYLNSLDNLNNNYVKFNGNETWRIKGIEGGRLVVTKTADINNTFTNSNLFNISNTLTDDSLVTSMSTDNKAYYLKKTVKIVGGTGTSSDPYILENNIDDIDDRKIVGYLTYNNGGTNLTPRQPIYYGKANYISMVIDYRNFLGWSTTANGSVEYKLGDVLSFSANTTLYAIKAVGAGESLISTFSQTSCVQNISYNGPYTGDLNGGKVLYFIENDEKTNTNSNGCLANYLWYSGKLWRIVAIYPNGMMKLITENLMTVLPFASSSSTFNGSWIDQWLTQEFLPTLYNSENVIQDGEWNVTASTTSNDPYTLANQVKVTRKVGLLNAFEFASSYTSSASNSYLFTGLDWWLMNAYNATKSWYIIYSGSASNYGVSYGYGVRPAIYLQSMVTLSGGTGTRSDPFTLNEDAAIANNNSLLLERANSLNGEYIKFNGEKYRIVSRENDTTKIVKADYVKNGNTVLTKSLSEDSYFDTQSSTDAYWDNYLLNTWYNAISNTYKEMIATNTEGESNLAGKYYKKLFTSGIYTDAKSTNAAEYYYSKVGLLGYGDMFANQQSLDTHLNNRNSYPYLWLSTPYNDTTDAWTVRWTGYISNAAVSSSYAVRPTINLKSTIKITCDSGNGYICNGTYDKPYDLT